MQAAFQSLLVVFPSRRDELTIARSFNCGCGGDKRQVPAGRLNNVQSKTNNRMGKREIQPSRWDELCVRTSNPQLKLRAIVKSAAGALGLFAFELFTTFAQRGREYA